LVVRIVRASWNYIRRVQAKHVQRKAFKLAKSKKLKKSLHRSCHSVVP